MSWIIQWLISSYNTVVTNIAFDAVSKNEWVWSRTFSHTISWTNTILFVCSMLTSWSTSAVTYNGVSLTNITNRTFSGWAWQASLWYIVNPTSWTNNIVVTTSWWYTRAVATSYTWAKQTWVPDAFSSNFNDSGVASFTSVITTVWSNWWHIAWAYANTTSISSWSWTTLRTTSWDSAMFDSNWPVSWTSTLNMIPSSSASYVVVGATFLPA